MKETLERIEDLIKDIEEESTQYIYEILDDVYYEIHQLKERIKTIEE